ncbi:MAG TPA: peroxide stress protein YaaA [Propionibacteriaceae bacterium]|nr:peroxide stress protein YaaA [Propionibacteriaceae bacterium]HQE31860.1 peroxide stress protein YaaA [Propionibacteriaceae bacterium]
MLALLSPAKTLDYTSPLPTRKHSEPRLLDESQALIDVMRTRSVADIASMMSISDELAAVNAQRYQDFQTPFTMRNARAAALAFAGDVYLGLAARTRFDERDWTEAQKSVRILSGLYGVLRPLDLMQPYRLEMGTAVPTVRGRSLYDWWGDTVSLLLRDDVAASPGAKVIVNLASDEYAKVVRPRVVDAEIISPRFEDTDAKGRRTVVSFFAKRARGEMAGWLVTERVRTASALTRFDSAGYRFDPASSRPDRPVFVRSYGDRPAIAAQTRSLED